MSPDQLVEWILRQKVTALAVQALDDAQLCAVSGHLGQDYDENGISGMLLGLCLVESARRFALLVAARPADALPAYEFPENPNWDTQES